MHLLLYKLLLLIIIIHTLKIFLLLCVRTVGDSNKSVLLFLDHLSKIAVKTIKTEILHKLLFNFFTIKTSNLNLKDVSI